MMLKKIIAVLFFISFTADASYSSSLLFQLQNNGHEQQPQSGPAYTYCRLSRQVVDNDPPKALAYARKGLELYTKNNDIANKSVAYYFIGLAHKHLGQFDSALFYYKLSYKDRLVYKTDPLLMSEVLNGMGIIYSQRGIFSEGLDYFLKALDIYEKAHDSDKIAKGLTNIANVYYSLNQVDKAVPYYERSLEIKERLKDGEAINSGRINLASIYIDRKQFKEARNCLDAALNYALKTNNMPDQAIIYLRLGYLNIEVKEFKNSIAYFEKALVISEKLNDEFGIMAALGELGSGYYEMGDYRNAIRFSERSLEYAKRSDSQAEMCDRTEIIAYSYDRLGDHKAAYDWLFTHINYYTAMQRQLTSDKVTELQQKFEVAEKEKKLNQLNAEKVSREIELYRKKNQVNYILAIAIAVIFLLSLFYYRYVLKQKNIRIKQEAELNLQRINAIEEKRLLQEKQQNELLHVIINVQEEERKKIAVDIHDGLGQLLSGIKMNLQLALNDPAISRGTEQTLKNILELNNESITESRSIASDLLPYNIKDFGLVTAIKNLCYKNNQLKISNITFYSNDVPRKLPGELEITLYRIAQELINNALKHAKASEIFVQLFFRENKLILQIEDNGIGYLQSEAEKKPSSMGLKNIAIRVKLLAGHLEVDSVGGKGTTTLVEFSIL